MNNSPFFRTLKHESTTFDSGNGSSVMNNTLSRLTLANNKISLNNNVQYCLTDRPSTRDRSPPKTMKMKEVFNHRIGKTFHLYSPFSHRIQLNSVRNFIPKIHCRPGDVSTNGLHLVNTIRASKSCSVNKGRPSPSGSIIPPPTVISRYADCISFITIAKFLCSSLSMRQ